MPLMISIYYVYYIRYDIVISLYPNDGMMRPVYQMVGKLGKRSSNRLPIVHREYVSGIWIHTPNAPDRSLLATG